MRWTMIAAVVVAASVPPTLSGCGESSPETKKVQQKLGETWDAMKSWGIDKKDDLVKSSSEGLDTLKQKMADAKQAAPGVSADARQKLDEEWKVVQGKFDEMKSASGATWDKARDGFLKAYDDFKKKLSAATAK